MLEGILSTGQLLASIHCNRPMASTVHCLFTELRSVYVRIQEQVSSTTLKVIVKGYQACNIHITCNEFIIIYVSILSPFYLAGKYDYQYLDRQREGEKEGEKEDGESGEKEDGDGFSSRSGQRTMNKDIIKQEIAIAQGTLLKIPFQPITI